MLKTTHWTKIYASTDPSHPDGAQALARVLETYRSPCVEHLMARFRVQRTQAEDWTHSFIERKILQKSLLSQAQHRKGRFRNFLLTALDRYAIDEIRRHRPAESLETYTAELQEKSGEASTTVFEHHWVKALLQSALREAQQHYQKRGRSNDWQVFKDGFLTPKMTGNRGLTRKQLASKYGYPSEAKANNAITNVIRLIRQRIKIAIVQYTSDDEQIGDEITELRSLLSIPADS